VAVTGLKEPTAIQSQSVNGSVGVGHVADSPTHVIYDFEGVHLIVAIEERGRAEAGIQ
jgi:hypothetical protein